MDDGRRQRNRYTPTPATQQIRRDQDHRLPIGRRGLLWGQIYSASDSLVVARRDATIRPVVAKGVEFLGGGWEIAHRRRSAKSSTTRILASTSDLPMRRK